VDGPKPHAVYASGFPPKPKEFNKSVTAAWLELVMAQFLEDFESLARRWVSKETRHSSIPLLSLSDVAETLQ
jgi:hypothetical protein